MASAQYHISKSEDGMAEVLTDLYKTVKDVSLTKIKSFNRDLGQDLSTFQTMWKKCWQEYSNFEKEIRSLRAENELLHKRLSSLNPSAQKQGALSAGEMKSMILGSFDNKKQAQLMEHMKEEAAKQMNAEKWRQEKEQMQKQIEQLNTDLARILGTKMSADERNVENVNESCRPSVIAGEYKSFCSKQWLNAKEAVDRTASKHRLDERTICVLLSSILEIASQSAVACVNVMMEGLRVSPAQLPDVVDTVICTQLSKDNPMAQKQKIIDGDKRRLTEDVRVAVTKYLKIFADDVHTLRWTQEVLKRVLMDLKLEKNKALFELYNNPPVNKYIVGACKLSWRMAVQLPPMTLTCRPLTFDESIHELAMSSPPPRDGSIVDYCVTPVLKHEPHVMVKGKVMLTSKYK